MSILQRCAIARIDSYVVSLRFSIVVLGILEDLGSLGGRGGTGDD